MLHDQSNSNANIGCLAYPHQQDVGAYQLSFNVGYRWTAKYIYILVKIELDIKARLLLMWSRTKSYGQLTGYIT